MKPIVGLVVIVLCLSACAGASSPPGDFAALTASLAERAPGWMEQYHIPGAAIALVHNGEVAWAQGFGQADKAKNIPVTPDTIFQVAWLSKPVSAWGIMTLVEEGRISLDTPVDPLLTAWHLPPSSFDVKGVTVERLLSHTAGLSLPYYIGYDPDPNAQPDYDSFERLELVREPGSSYLYSSGGYNMLQLLVMEMLGQLFEHFMDERVLIPLGMDASRYDIVSHPALATPYDRAGEPMPAYVFIEIAAAGLYSNAKEMGYFVAANMPGPNGEPAGRGVLKPETVARMLTAMPNTGGHQGLGFALDTLPDGTQIFYHTGSNRGWKSYMAGVPARGEGLVTLTNSEGGAAFNESVNCAWIGWVSGAVPIECQLDTLLPVGIGITVVVGIGLIWGVLRLWRRKAKPAQV